MLTDAMRSALTAIPGLSVLTEPDDLERYSRDAYDYSPVLRERLADCRADVVVRPDSVDAVVQVAGLCHRHGVPLTLRGSGTGNYGQCVPLEAGVVMLMSHLRSVRAIDSVTGDVTVECGCLLKDLNRDLVAQGRQLRLMPSTWRSATIGGFIAGGSGGIGSVRWGFLRDPGHLLGLEVVTLEPQPRVLQLEASEAEALNHAYGTNGIITALKLATASSIAWQELVVDCPIGPRPWSWRDVAVRRPSICTCAPCWRRRWWSSCPGGICRCQRRTVCCCSWRLRRSAPCADWRQQQEPPSPIWAPRPIGMAMV